MGCNENLILPRKADWLSCLKPRASPASLKLDHLYGSADEAEETNEPPNKRHQGDKGEGLRAYLSPDTSGAACTVERMESLSSPPSEVKSPRPAISIGLREDALIIALQLPGLPGAKAKRFNEALAKPHPHKNTALLHSQPTHSELPMRFPNQAAVSGACSLKLLHNLDDLVRTSDSGSYSKRQPIVFSVCTEGPIHQLWAHYTTVEDGDGDSEGDRAYNMAQVKICDVGTWDDVSGFLQAVNNVMRWGSGNHKNASNWQRGHRVAS
ncbi:hypothetical protein MMC07_004972 [Pseudocyphellaria aurata]|nr:hypothetical protein [Pseudocyphellaria aurata]